MSPFGVEKGDEMESSGEKQLGESDESLDVTLRRKWHHHRMQRMFMNVWVVRHCYCGLLSLVVICSL